MRWLVAISLFGHLSFAEDSTNLTASTRCEILLLTDQTQRVMVRLNDLTITYDQQVFWRGRLVKLMKRGRRNSPILMRILLHLVDYPYQVISSEDLRDNAWISGREHRTGLRDMVSTAIAVIQNSFEQADPEFRSIKNVWGVGYVWDDREAIGASESQTPSPVQELKRDLYKIEWRGRTVGLTNAQRRMVDLLLQRIGQPVSKIELFSVFRGHRAVSGNDNSTFVSRVVSEQMFYIRNAFKTVDPEFDRLEAGIPRTWLVK